MVKKDIENNIIYISKDSQTNKIQHDKFIARNINWIPNKPEFTEMFVKLRHGPNKTSCRLEFIDNNTAYVYLDEPDQGISTGQFSIFYKDGYCLGGGAIEQI